MRIHKALFVIMTLVAISWAQQPASTMPAIPDGVIVKVEAKQAVETQKAKVGDPMKIEVLEDGKDKDGKIVRGPDGKPAVPRKTKLLARVTSIKAATKESKDARLSLVVTSATFPDGKTVPFLGVVLGPFKVSSLEGGTGIDTGGGWGFSKEKLEGPEVPSGIQGVDIKPDEKLGTVLVAPNNFSLDNGTQFHVRYVDLAAHQAETKPPGQ